MKQFYYILVILFLAHGSANATTHVITAVFGSSGFVYSPSTPFTVHVGDTIDWQMNFSIHTLLVKLNGTNVVDDGGTSATPPGGSDEKYVVPSAGTYNFVCTIHSTMNSSFTAVASGVQIPPQTNVVMTPVYPNPANEESMVDFTLDKPAHVTLRIYNAKGALMQTPADENMASGFHMLMIDTKSFVAGSYQYVLQAGDAVLQRDAIVVK